MCDLFNEVREHCGYELGEIRRALDELPTYASERDKAWAVRKVFMRIGGFGWGVGGEVQIEIDVRGIWLYEMVDGTSGNTRVLEHMDWAELVREADEITDKIENVELFMELGVV